MLLVLCIIIGLVIAFGVANASGNLSKQGIECGRSVDSVSCSTCAGSSSKCEQKRMMEAATQPIEYFDDEELDRYRGREADTYSEDEAEEFAEVLRTMRQNEVKDWCRSLTLRGISLPDQLKDEAFMLMEG